MVDEGDRQNTVQVAVMPTKKEYREYADECLGWAKTAKSDKEREIFLQMAQTWLEGAYRAGKAADPFSRAPRPLDDK
jgi:hypothetical protein